VNSRASPEVAPICAIYSFLDCFANINGSLIVSDEMQSTPHMFVNGSIVTSFTSSAGQRVDSLKSVLLSSHEDVIQFEITIKIQWNV
jgi:hypothetical protein